MKNEQYGKNPKDQFNKTQHQGLGKQQQQHHGLGKQNENKTGKIQGDKNRK